MCGETLVKASRMDRVESWQYFIMGLLYLHPSGRQVMKNFHERLRQKAIDDAHDDGFFQRWLTQAKKDPPKFPGNKRRAYKFW